MPNCLRAKPTAVRLDYAPDAPPLHGFPKMNIFYLDHDPHIAAKWHGDKHVSKMTIETAQMLSTAHHVLAGESASEIGIYKPTHINHPCSIWVRENSSNYQWAFELLDGLCREFHVRRGKLHATQRLLPILSQRPSAIPIAELGFPALAMPDEFKTDCPVESYRRYYRSKFDAGIVSYNWSEERTHPWWLITDSR